MVCYKVTHGVGREPLESEVPCAAQEKAEAAKPAAMNLSYADQMERAGKALEACAKRFGPGKCYR